jgi:hypothetical protein
MGKMKDLYIEEQEKHLSSEETGLSFELNRLMGSNKAYRTALAQTVVDDVSNGQLDPKEVFIYAKKGEEFFKSVFDNVKPFVTSKTIQKGGITMYEATIVEKKDPDKYDYSVCSDFEWNRLNKLLEETKAKLKVREKFLKALTEPISTLEGEIINPPSVTHGAQNIAITMK